MTASEFLLGASLFIPLLAALVIAGAGGVAFIRSATSLIASAAVAVVGVLVMMEVGAGKPVALQLAALGPGLGLRLEVDRLGAVFGVMASCLWFANTLFTIVYARAKVTSGSARFFSCIALAITMTLGVAYAADLFTLFVFYELLTLSTYPLVIHSGDAASRAAGRQYLAYLVIPAALFLLPATALTQAVAGSTDFTPGGLLAGRIGPELAGVLLLLIVLGAAKAALFPFHAWLPGAMVAPAPVSALLHAVAVVKSGVFLLLKTTAFILGPDLVAQTPVTPFLLALAGVTLFVSSAIALRQAELKARLAWSTVAQLAFITAAALMGTAGGFIAGGLHMVAHAVGKITLFMCAGVIYLSAGVTRPDQMKGLGRETPFVFWAFLIGALSTAGLPPTGGMWSKFLIIREAFSGGMTVLAWAMIGSALLTVLYLVPVALMALMVPPSREAPWFRAGVRRSAPPALAAIFLTAAAAACLFVVSDMLMDYLAADWEGYGDGR
jgi:multicomponent Na+:H+ antiporter subunit D